MINSESLLPNETNELSAERKTLMAEFGITHLLVDNFHYRGHRYTKLDDAIAQARHDLAK
jgi:hypothetical protein